jgi:hypothetical protein
MRELFFYVLGGVLVIAAAGWGLYMIGRAVMQVIGDWKLGRELDELESEGESRREKRKLAQIERLANGCDHDFSSGAIGLPPNVCHKCGVEKEKPSGLCDHVWRVVPGAVPYSQCERCDKIYKPLPHVSDSTQR